MLEIPCNTQESFYVHPSTYHWILDAPIVVETDASDYAIARILSIVCPDSELRLVVFYSRTLSTLELNYDTHDKELLAIYEAFWTW
jgi:hypothetical protein